jgi:hypothetical protein
MVKGVESLLCKCKALIQTSGPQNKTNKQRNKQDQDDYRTKLILPISLSLQIPSSVFSSL